MRTDMEQIMEKKCVVFIIIEFLDQITNDREKKIDENFFSPNAISR